MLVYRKIPQCRICSHAEGDKIDKALVERMSYPRIVETFEALFPPDAPLTKAAVYNHYKHVKEAVQEAVAIQLATQPKLPPALDPNNLPHTPERQAVFEGMVKEQLNEIEAIQHLAHSGLRELKQLELNPDDPDDPAYDLDKMVFRNKVRKDTAAIVKASADIKKMAAEASEDVLRMEKGRLVFRMFELLKNAIEVVPGEFRSLVAERLKDGFRKDDELKDLLRVHQADPKQGGGTA